jgi:shikimate kinase
MKTLPSYYTGRKAKVGGICFDDRNRMHIFVAYCDGCRGKVLMTVDEAREFSDKYNTNKKRTKRLVKKVDRLTI